MAEILTIKLEPAELQNKIGDINSSGLQRNILTADGKRWQLWGRGIRGSEADAIIAELYPAENA